MKWFRTAAEGRDSTEWFRARQLGDGGDARLLEASFGGDQVVLLADGLHPLQDVDVVLPADFGVDRLGTTKTPAPLCANALSSAVGEFAVDVRANPWSANQ